MANRFVGFADGKDADYTVCGTGFTYLELTEAEAEAVMATAAEYTVIETETHTYSHEEYGSYVDVEEIRRYDLAACKSLSEKIWEHDEKACDIIVADGVFLGVVFFTGFTDPSGLKKHAFVPTECIASGEIPGGKGFLKFNVFIRKDVRKAQTSYQTAETENASGRSTSSYRRNFYLDKK